MIDHDHAQTIDNDTEDGDFGLLYLRLAPIKEGTDEANIDQ